MSAADINGESKEERQRACEEWVAVLNKHYEQVRWDPVLWDVARRTSRVVFHVAAEPVKP